MSGSKTEKKEGRTIREKLISALPWLVFIALAGGWILFYLLRVERLLDADMSSEMVLSSILAKQHRIITPDWKYSTEIRVLNNQIFFSLFLALTKSWRISRLLSGVVLLALYAASYYYLCARAGLKKAFPYTAVLLFLPFSADYAYIVLYGLYYIPHIAISFATAALILHFEQASSARTKMITGALLLLLSVAAGLGGPRQIVICYLPALLLAILRSCEERRFSHPGAWIAFFGGGIGFALNHFVLSANYRFNSWNDLHFTGFSFSRLETLLMGILHEYGFTEGPVFSSALVKNAAALLIVGGILLYSVCHVSQARKRDARERFVAGLAGMVAAVYFLLYLFTDMFYEDRYALPVIVFAAPLAAFALERVFGEAKEKRELFWQALPLAAVLAAVLAAGAGHYLSLWRSDVSGTIREASEALAAQGYEAGYASYWNGNIVTELSEGRIEMYNWDDHVDGKVDVDELYIWLQPVSHIEGRPQGKVFILLGTQEETECPLVRYLTEEDVAFRNADYVAYGFEDREAMLGALSDYRYDLSETDWLEGGEGDGASWTLHGGAVTSGPNMTFYAGTYELCVSGSGVDGLKLEVKTDFGEGALPAEFLSAADGEARWRISAPENAYHVEFCLENPSDADIRIDNIETRRNGND
ncbi:MAG: hypothetical protein K6E50_04610 [Lachnospiraceae bacterium]|nr:hypothetical protein [Lachnospiraceae bacterium]